MQLVCFYSQWISKLLRKIGNLKICIRNECFLLLRKVTLHIWSESKQVGGISTAFSHLEGANSILKHHRHIRNFFTWNSNASYIKEGKMQLARFSSDVRNWCWSLAFHQCLIRFTHTKHILHCLWFRLSIAFPQWGFCRLMLYHLHSIPPFFPQSLTASSQSCKTTFFCHDSC